MAAAELSSDAPRALPLVIGTKPLYLCLGAYFPAGTIVIALGEEADDG